VKKTLSQESTLVRLNIKSVKLFVGLIFWDWLKFTY